VKAKATVVSGSEKNRAERRAEEVAAKAHAERRAIFIKKLARYLVGDQARKSIELQMGKQDAKEWADIRGATPLFGYPTVEEAEKKLTEFLGK
jgi:hypothetical protein